jgi:hypothetical protein
MQDLPFQTLTQFAALALTLIAGWVLGLASASGGRKWRDRFYDEEINSAGYRDRAESDLRDAARRIRDLEAENARLRAAAPVAAPAPDPEPAHEEGHSNAALAGAAIAGAAAGAVAAHAAHEHHEAHAEPAADHAEPAITNGPIHYAEPAAPARDSHGDDHHAPADAHHH